MTNARAGNVPISKDILRAKDEECRRVLPSPRQHSCVEMAPEAMDRTVKTTERGADAPKVLSDYPEIRRPSKWEEFVSDLKLIGFALIIVVLIWAVGYFKGS
jgi:hypothetical protein